MSFQNFKIVFKVENQIWKKFQLIISTHLLSFLKMVLSKFSAWKNTSSHFMMKIHFMIDVILHRLRTGSRQKWLTVQNVISMLRKKICKIWMRKHFVRSIIREELKQHINIIAFFLSNAKVQMLKIIKKWPIYQCPSINKCIFHKNFPRSQMKSFFRTSRMICYLANSLLNSRP